MTQLIGIETKIIAFKYSILFSLLLFLPGCSGFKDAANTIDRDGPSSLSGSNYQASTNPRLTPAGMFERSWAKAVTDQAQISSGAQSAPTLSSDQSSKDFRQMAVDGISLVNINCDDFFRSGGEDQKWLLLAKDITAAAGSIATGVLALSSKGNATAAGAVSLTTAAAYNGVDIYARNFLFGSDNIEYVHTLTTSVLQAHQKALFPPNDQTVWTFSDAVSVVTAHQTMCGPAAIRASVLDAIKSGKATAYTASGPAFSTTAQSPTQNATAATNAVLGAAADAGAKASPAIAAASPGAAPAAASAAAAAATTAAAQAAANGSAAADITKAASDAGTAAATAAVTNAAPTASAADIQTLVNAVVKPIAPAAAAGATAPSSAGQVSGQQDHDVKVKINPQ